jgi:hypothetical protein
MVRRVRIQRRSHARAVDDSLADSCQPLSGMPSPILRKERNGSVRSIGDRNGGRGRRYDRAGVDPFSWTLFRLCRLLLAPPAFVRDWAEIVNGRMTSMRVVEALDEIEDGEARLAVIVKDGPVDQLAFECGEKALGKGVVEAISCRSH